MTTTAQRAAAELDRVVTVAPIDHVRGLVADLTAEGLPTDLDVDAMDEGALRRALWDLAWDVRDPEATLDHVRIIVG